MSEARRDPPDDDAAVDEQVLPTVRLKGAPLDQAPGADATELDDREPPPPPGT